MEPEEGQQGIGGQISTYSFWDHAVKKVSMKQAIFIANLIVSCKIAPYLKAMGVDLDPVTLTAAIAGAIQYGIFHLCEYLQNKYNIPWI